MNRCRIRCTVRCRIGWWPDKWREAMRQECYAIKKYCLRRKASVSRTVMTRSATMYGDQSVGHWIKVPSPSGQTTVSLYIPMYDISLIFHRESTCFTDFFFQPVYVATNRVKTWGVQTRNVFIFFKNNHERTFVNLFSRDFLFPPSLFSFMV